MMDCVVFVRHVLNNENNEKFETLIVFTASIFCTEAFSEFKNSFKCFLKSGLFSEISNKFANKWFEFLLQKTESKYDKKQYYFSFITQYCCFAPCFSKVIS